MCFDPGGDERNRRRCRDFDRFNFVVVIGRESKPVRPEATAVLCAGLVEVDFCRAVDPAWLEVRVEGIAVLVELDEGVETD